MATLPSKMVSTAQYWLPLVTLIVYSLTARWNSPVFIDSYGAALEAWAWASNGVPWLDDIPPALVDFRGPFPEWLFVDNGVHIVTTRTIGVVASAIPFSLLTQGSFALWPSTLTAVLLAVASVTFMHRALAAIVSPGVALAGALVFAFATPTWSVTADSLLTHALTQAAIGAAAWAAAYNRWWWAGIALGLGMTGRTHLALIAAALGIGVAWSRRQPAIAAALALPTATALVGIVAVNDWRYGSPGLSGGYSSYADDNLVESGTRVWVDYLLNWVGFLASADRGILLWTPLIMVLAVPAVRAARSAPDWVNWLAVGGIAYAAVQLKINNFSGADGFYGYRLGLELMTCLVPLYTLAWLQLRRDWSRALAAGVAWMQFAVIAPGAVVFGLFVPLQEVWSQSSYLIALREMPALSILPLAIATVGCTLTVKSVARTPE